MDSKYSQGDVGVTVVRTARQASKEAVRVEQRATAHRKRKRKGVEKGDPLLLGNGDGDQSKTSVHDDDEESPNKIPKLGQDEKKGISSEIEEDNISMETDHDQDSEADQDMTFEEGGDHPFKSCPTKPLSEVTNSNLLEEQHLETVYRLRRRSIRENTSVSKSQKAKNESPMEGSASVHTLYGTHSKPLRNQATAPTLHSSSRQYQDKLLEKVKDLPKASHQSWERYTQPAQPYTTKMWQQQPNNVSHMIPLKQQRKKESTKPVIAKAALKSSSEGRTSKLCHLLWALLVLGLVALGLCSKKFLSSFPLEASARSDQFVSIGTFETQLAQLEVQFPSQRSELWRRSRIHLMGHLQKTQPSEPVSLILTSGRGAEKTLSCLARQMAAAFSSAFNASVLDINGASKAEQDSDEVKLDIDTALREAFDGDRPAAVIHRFEELPPGSTLIFYRYCDHENAAYKNVLLVFTVLLPLEALEPGLSLKVVEEMVQEHVKEKFVPSDHSVAFNQMDLDKLSGLWSRISHLILPVAAEKQLDQKGCGDL